MSTETAINGNPRYVLKWPLRYPVTTVSMPDDAVVIDVQTQHGVPTLWTLSSTDSVDVERTFVGFGTGHPIFEGDLTYVGSAHDVEGEGLVFHIFERPSGNGSKGSDDR